MFGLLVLLADNESGTADSTGSAGGNETDLLTGRGVAPDCRRLTNMLMITTTVRMFDGILGDTTNLGPAVSLHAVLVVGSAGLEHGLVDSSSACDEA